jgi:predicted RNase H-like HicB family nuclease
VCEAYPEQFLFRISGDMEMHAFSVIVERDLETSLLVGSVPGWPGAHSQGATFDELEKNLREVIGMLLEDGEPQLESQFVGLQTIEVA